MGREVTCLCQWGTESAECKVLLETQDLIVRQTSRGPLRHQVPLTSLAEVKVQDGQLQFKAGPDLVKLDLGKSTAQSWAKKLVTPPPSLASKLGISNGTKLLLLGTTESDELEIALSQAETASSKTPNMILINADSQSALERALQRATAFTPQPPIWIVYPKGSKSNLPESVVRSTLRSQGFIDVKVASVSSTQTALRFIRKS